MQGYICCAHVHHVLGNLNEWTRHTEAQCPAAHPNTEIGACDGHGACVSCDEANLSVHGPQLVRLSCEL
jgi:hypothetical protein